MVDNHKGSFARILQPVLLLVLVALSLYLLYALTYRLSALERYFKWNADRVQKFEGNDGWVRHGVLVEEYESDGETWYHIQPPEKSVRFDCRQSSVASESPYRVSSPWAAAVTYQIETKGWYAPVLILFLTLQPPIMLLTTKLLTRDTRRRFSVGRTARRAAWIFFGFLAGGWAALLIGLVVKNATLAGFIGSNLSGYVLGRYAALRSRKQTESLMTDLGVTYFRGGFEWYPPVASWRERLIRAAVSSAMGTVITALLAIPFGLNIIASFLGGYIGGQLVGNYFAKDDYVKLKRMYADLDIPHYEGG